MQLQFVLLWLPITKTSKFQTVFVRLIFFLHVRENFEKIRKN